MSIADLSREWIGQMQEGGISMARHCGTGLFSMRIHS